MQLKVKKTQSQTETKPNVRKQMIQIIAEINDIKTRRTIHKSMKQRADSLKR